MFNIRFDVNQVLEQLKTTVGENIPVNNEQYIPLNQSLTPSMEDEKLAKRKKRNKIITIVVVSIIVAIVLGLAAIAGLGYFILYMIRSMG